MKLKIIFISSIILLAIFLIYLTTIDKKIYFLALGDSIAYGETPYGHKDESFNDFTKEYLKNKNLLEKYIDNFIEPDYRTTDLINDIKNNKKIKLNGKDQTLKNALIKADLVTLSIGANDLIYKFSISNLNNDELYNYIDGLMNDINDLFKLLREYCKEDIVVINFYRPISFLEINAIKEHYAYANETLDNLAQAYKIHLIKADQLLENKPLYTPDVNKIFLSRSGHEVVSNEINKVIEKFILKNK